MGTIETFRQLMDEITYSWEPGYELERHARDDHWAFSLNKLFITPTEVSYKLERWRLASGVFEKLETFWQLLQEGTGG